MRTFIPVALGVIVVRTMCVPSALNATVRDTATFEKPHSYAEGVSLVIVNGQVAFEAGKMTEARPGRVLYGPARK